MANTSSISRPLVSISLTLLLGAGVAVGQDTAKRGRKYKAPPPTSHFVVTVVRATNGKPVENASVVFHPLENGRDNGNMELKTNDEGKATIDLLEIGTDVRMQIIAPGFQTFGKDYKVDKDQITIQVKLNRPTEQYSIYKDHSRDAKTQDEATPKSADEPQKDSPDATQGGDTAKPAPSDAPKPQGR